MPTLRSALRRAYRRMYSSFDTARTELRLLGLSQAQAAGTEEGATRSFVAAQRVRLRASAASSVARAQKRGARAHERA